MHPDFEALFHRARELLDAHPAARQAVVLRTGDGTLRETALEEVMSAEEDAFVHALGEAGDTRVLCMVCVWRAGPVLDLPSMHLRKSLLELDPANRDTGILLHTDGGFRVRTVGETMP